MIEKFRVGDFVPGLGVVEDGKFKEVKHKILQIIPIPKERKELSKLISQLLKEHPHTFVYQGSNLADKESNALRVDIDALYLMEIRQ